MPLSVFAEEVKSVVKFDPSEDVPQGDIVNISLQMWPVENIQPEFFQEYKGKIIFNHFYVTSVSAKRSENNFDVLIVNFETVASTPAKKFEQISFLVQGISINFDLPMNILPIQGEVGQFVIFNQSLEPGNALVIKILTIISLVILLSLVGYIVYQKLKIRRKVGLSSKKNKERYQLMFLEAKKREDFEKIYSSRENWLIFFDVKPTVIFDFFKLMEEHQYKEKWKPEDLYEVVEVFDKIRNGIK